MLTETLIGVAVLTFLACYLVGLRSLRTRLLVLLGFLLFLAFAVPNVRHDSVLFLERDVIKFTTHLSVLAEERRWDELDRQLRAFNRSFPGVARDTEATYEFVNHLVNGPVGRGGRSSTGTTNRAIQASP